MSAIAVWPFFDIMKARAPSKDAIRRVDGEVVLRIFKEICTSSGLKRCSFRRRTEDWVKEPAVLWKETEDISAPASIAVKG